MFENSNLQRKKFEKFCDEKVEKFEKFITESILIINYIVHITTQQPSQLVQLAVGTTTTEVVAAETRVESGGES